MKARPIITAVISVFFASATLRASDSLYTSFINAEVSVVDLKETEGQVRAFVEARNIIPDYFWTTKSDMTIKMTLSRGQYAAIVLILDDWGYVYKNKVTSTNYASKLDKAQRDMEELEMEIARYNQVMDRLLDTSDRYFTYWEKVMVLEKELAVLATYKGELQNVKREFNVIVLFKEEANTTNQEGVNWVNMPGVEYSILFTENPIAGLSPKQMRGYSMKYMFTRGKTYGLLSIYKSTESNSEGTSIDDIYMLGVGQDLYSKHLGRGKHKFFNLYTSFTAGGYLASGPERTVASAFINPYFGVEIFKSKNILIDNKVGYFLPFAENRTARGLLYSVSLNFVF
ncbi:MAG: hypothetical protein JKY52_04910 [Flavobacteriales bacterium]|nr:hypothetical protein [Flavobacteriales bacterium]